MIHAKKLSGSFANISAGVVLGLTILVGNGYTAAEDFVPNAAPAPEATASTNMIVVDLSTNPNDLSLAVNQITATVKEARAANQKVIIMLGEEHTTIAHVRLPELLRQNFKNSGIGNPVMAVEQQNNLLEYLVPRHFPDDESARILQALGDLKKNDPARYRNLQALAHTTLDWPEAPLTRLENFMDWIEDRADVRLVDMPRIKKGDDSYLDITDPATAAFIRDRKDGSVEDIKAGSIEALRLRNAWMASELRDILRKNDIVILQTGLNHLGGDPYMRPYKHSLHAIFENAVNDNIKIVTVFQEKTNFLTIFGKGMDARYEYLLSSEARAAMNTSGTVILRGSSGEQHDQTWLDGTFAAESAALTDIARSTNAPDAMPRIDDEKKYRAQLQKNRETLKGELDKLVAPQQKAPEIPAGPG